jgi:hypothetical protein
MHLAEKRYQQRCPMSCRNRWPNDEIEGSTREQLAVHAEVELAREREVGIVIRPGEAGDLTPDHVLVEAHH